MNIEHITQLYRFAEFGRLSSGIFHDLLNPLTTVLLTVEYLQNEASERSPESAAHLAQAVRASKRIEAFIQTAKKQLDMQGSQEVFALEDEARDAIDLLAHKSRKAGVEVRAATSGQTLVRGNSVKFFQICANLLSNAIDSYAESPEQTAQAVKAHVVSLSIDSDGLDIRMTVRDFGQGIAPHLHERIFDHFYTTKPKRAGMGLGLSATKMMVETDFGGSISLESAPGKGSAFTVHLPTRLRERRRRRLPEGE